MLPYHTGMWFERIACATDKPTSVGQPVLADTAHAVTVGTEVEPLTARHAVSYIVGKQCRRGCTRQRNVCI